MCIYIFTFIQMSVSVYLHLFNNKLPTLDLSRIYQLLVLNTTKKSINIEQIKKQGKIPQVIRNSFRSRI